MTYDDRIETIARSLAEEDGHDPDAVLAINSKRGPYTGAPVDDSARPVWRNYVSMASAADSACLSAFVAEVERRALEFLAQDHKTLGYRAAMKQVMAERT